MEQFALLRLSGRRRRMNHPRRGQRNTRVPAAILLLALVATQCRHREAADAGPPYPAQEALFTFEIEEGFQIDLFAAEPLVRDPVAMEVDELGRVYVVEMPGYPLDVTGTGRIKLLTDTDGDGRPDRSTLFADGLVLPTGIMRWKGGVLVTDAPHVYYLEDTSGDGQADVKRVVLTGFARSNPQHNFNGPLYGLDNWIYLANNRTISTRTYAHLFGDVGEEIRFADREDGPRLPRNAGGRNVRFRPDAHELEMLSGWSQFGHTFDAWGRHLLVSNAHHIFHEVVAARYLERNPDLLVTGAVHHMPDHGSAARVFPITLNPDYQLLTDRGVITSASGITCYLGGAFPPGYDGVAFVAESVHNLVHADRISDAGATFVAGRLSEKGEFLASTDSWFRPVSFYIGPDGALYVIDYYRRFVEHPQWMDDETAAGADLYSGSDLGRIYRVAPRGFPPPSWVNRLPLGEASDEELVRLLEHPNVWYRRSAQRLLVDRRTPAAAALERLARESPSPQGRVHALWTLDGLGRLEAGLVSNALSDAVPGVRENAVRLAELHLTRAPELSERLLALQDDPDPKVRFQLLLTLGELDGPSVRDAREKLLFHDLEDEWVQVAALTARDAKDPRLFEKALARLGDRETAGRRAYFQRISSLIGARNEAPAIRSLLRGALTARAPGAEWWRAAALQGLAEGLKGKGVPASILGAERERILASFLEIGQTSRPLREGCLALLEVLGLPAEPGARAALQRALAVASDRKADPDLRADALHLLSLSDPTPHAEILQQMIDPREPAPVQRAAVRTLGRIGGLEVPTFLLARWETLTPAVRDEAVSTFMLDRERVRLLLEAVESGVVQVSTVGWGRSVVLMRDWDGDIRDKARALLDERAGAPEAAVERYQKAVRVRGDAARGRDVFLAHCSQCHQMEGADGVDFGPDLATVGHWSPQALLVKILNPGRSVADGYELWVVRKTNGESVSGVMASETEAAVTFRNAGGADMRIPRSEIDSITATSASVMPGFERLITEEEMADLLAFIRFGR